MLAPQSNASSVNLNKHGSTWTKEEVADLVASWGEIENQRVLQSIHWNKAVYQKIAKEMAAKGCDCDWTQYQSECKVLRQQRQRIPTTLGTCRVMHVHYEEVFCIFTISDTVSSENMVDMEACTTPRRLVKTPK